MPKKTDDVMAEDKESVETLKDFVINHVNHFYINHIPFDSIKDMSDTYLYFFGTVAYIFSFVMFGYFFYQNYQSSLQQAFISLQQDAGNCNTVPIVIQGTYIADNKGHWNTNPSFLDVRAQYALRLAGFEISTDSQFVYMMSYFYDKLEELGKRASSNNLAENVLVWMTFIQYYSLDYSLTDGSFTNISSIGQLQAFAMFSDPSSLFNMNHLVSRIGSATGICDVPSYSEFDAANHLMQSVWNNYTFFEQSQLCNSAIYAKNFGYYSSIDADIFSIKLDVQSFVVALAANLEHIPLPFLTAMSNILVPFSFQGVKYSIGQYFDLRYAAMYPIYCIHNISEIPSSLYLPRQLCFLSFGSTFTLPVFNPFGTSYTAPMACECGEFRSGHTEACNSFNFLLGLVFYRNDQSDLNIVSTLRNLINGVITPEQVNVTNILVEFGVFSLLSNVEQYSSYATYNRQAYTASYYTAYTGGNTTTKEVADAYQSFCKLDDGSVCSMVAFNSFDENSHTVSIYKYQLRNGSCHNSISVPSSIWNELVASPPVQFTQEYYECYDNTKSAIVAAIGIAQGNTQTFLPIFVVLALPLLYLILVGIREVPPKEEYKDSEKNEVNEILALLLLRLRDGKTRGVKKQGVLMNLAKEMIAMAKEEGGYPDSDDEDEEEEEEGNEVGEDGGKESAEQAQSTKKKGNHPKGRVRADSDDEYTQRNTLANATISSSYQEDSMYERDEEATNRPSSGRRKAPKTLIIQGNKVIVEDKRNVDNDGNNSRTFIEHVRHVVAQRNRRKRMDVFTKRLQATSASTPDSKQNSRQSASTLSPQKFDERCPDSLVSNSDRPSSSFSHSRISAVGIFRRVTTSTGFSGHQAGAIPDSAPGADATSSPTSFWTGIFGANNNTAVAGASSSSHKTQEMRSRPSLAAVKSTKDKNNTANVLPEGVKPEDLHRSKKIEAYIDLTLYAVPQEVQILNIAFNASETTGAGGGGKTKMQSTRARKELSINELNILLNDLLRYLSEALSAPINADSTTRNNPLHSRRGDSEGDVLKVGRTQYRIDSVDSDVYHEITRRDHMAFQQQALPLSTRLATQGNWQYVMEELDETDRNGVALKLINILSMHASIEYGCSMSEVSPRYSKNVAYNIGQRLVTLYLLERLVR